MDVICATCKKQLSLETGGKLIIEGHYLYDEKTYCNNCWKIFDFGNKGSPPVPAS
jgi:DNA-directed RNA polymerase subunit RPC12/RpoP